MIFKVLSRTNVLNDWREGNSRRVTSWTAEADRYINHTVYQIHFWSMRHSYSTYVTACLQNTCSVHFIFTMSLSPGWAGFWFIASKINLHSPNNPCLTYPTRIWCTLTSFNRKQGVEIALSTLIMPPCTSTSKPFGLGLGHLPFSLEPYHRELSQAVVWLMSWPSWALTNQNTVLAWLRLSACLVRSAFFFTS